MAMARVVEEIGKLQIGEGKWSRVATTFVFGQCNLGSDRWQLQGQVWSVVGQRSW